MSNIFSTLSPFRLFIKYAVPNVISMAFISFYYVVDGIFVGKYLGSHALAALALIIPFVMMSFALADMIAIGSAVQISMHLGLSKKNLAKKIFSSSILIIFLISCFIGILEYFLSPILISYLNVNDEIKIMAKECMLIFALFAPFTMLSFALDNYLRICGKATYSMVMNVIIALSNIVFDYIFIVELGWGLFSAALATCLGLVLGGIFGIFPFLFENLELKFSSLYMNLRIFKNILYNGSSEFFGNISGSLYSVFANFVLLKISNTQAVAAFSIILYIDSFIIMLIIAIGDAMQPVLSYNYAKKDFLRIKAIMKVAFFAGGILSLFSMIVIFIFGENLIALFAKENDQEFKNFAYTALMLFTFNYLFAWFNVLSGSFLTAFNKASFSLILSLSQNLFMPLCFLLILSYFIGLNGVWLSPFFAEFCVLILTWIFLKKIFKDLSS
ncbi:MATE family efflux transporter [Campylobacter jejuni]|nr:MATE family efflux transporter [Campylobacter jejuni]ECP9272460.1 MATE family efflux transporter [Campylobacter jejuni]HEC2816224.1 MATE family efflux transporter [Campylobacter jejuni]